MLKIMSMNVYGYKTSNNKSSFVMGDHGALHRHWSPATALTAYQHPDEQRAAMERVNNNQNGFQSPVPANQSSSSDGLLGGLLLDNLLMSIFGPVTMIFTAVELMDQVWLDRRDPSPIPARAAAGHRPHQAHYKPSLFGLF
jgi:hypothetical protein